MKVKPEASIIILPNGGSLKRVLWPLALRKPKFSFEVLVISDKEADDAALRLFSSALHWRLVQSREKAVEQAEGEYLFDQDGRVVADGPTYDAMLEAAERATLVYAAAYELPDQLVRFLDTFGSNLSKAMVEETKKHPIIVPGEPTRLLTLTKKGVAETDSIEAVSHCIFLKETQ